tara:strand:- start:98 stop:790 length:693 start_codon:yes stop_codon:yes gene_type:complete
MFMLVNMNSLVAPYEVEGKLIDPKESWRDESEVKDFINLHMNTILQHIHLANSPESEIKTMMHEILNNAGMLDKESSEQPADDNEDKDVMSKLFDVLNKYEPILETSMKLAANCEGSKELNQNQFKFVFALQFFGITDCIAQQIKADEMVSMAAFAAKTTGGIFGWTAEEAGEVFSKICDVQEEPWAQQIIINGGQAVISATKEDEKDKLPLLKIFDDVALMKEAAKNIK